MICEKVKYSNFRNIVSTEVEFNNGINVLWGNNAQGKSNILEGIYYFARGKSFRGAKDKELINFDSDIAKVSMECLREEAKYSTKLELTIPRQGRKTISRGGAKISSAEMIGSFKGVLFAPSHLSLVSGAPALRRQFLDIAISQLSPTYLDAVCRYSTALDERNALIKAAIDGVPVSQDEWCVYADQLSTYGAIIAYCRLAYCSKMADGIKNYLGEMTGGKENTGIGYESHVFDSDIMDSSEGSGLSFTSPKVVPEWKNRLNSLLTENIDKEIRAKSTLWGAHKDDIVLSLCDKEARLYASQGQQRSIALAMKLSEGEISSEESGEYPVFLLDDVLSELDGDRRKYILGELKNRQIIVTSCEPALFELADSEVTMFRVENGTATKM